MSWPVEPSKTSRQPVEVVQHRRYCCKFPQEADHQRPPGAANPLANLWDNGADPVAGHT